MVVIDYSRTPEFDGHSFNCTGALSPKAYARELLHAHNSADSTSPRRIGSRYVHRTALA